MGCFLINHPFLGTRFLGNPHVYHVQRLMLPSLEVLESIGPSRIPGLSHSHRIRMYAIYGLPFAIKIYPRHVSINLPYIHGSVMGTKSPGTHRAFRFVIGVSGNRTFGTVHWVSNKNSSKSRNFKLALERRWNGILGPPEVFWYFKPSKSWFGHHKM